MISRVTRLDKERVEFFGCLMIQLCAVMYIHTPSLQQVDNPLSFVEEHGLSDHAIHFHGSFRECRWDVVTGALNQPVDRASTAAQLRPMFGVSLSSEGPAQIHLVRRIMMAWLKQAEGHPRSSQVSIWRNPETPKTHQAIHGPSAGLFFSA